MLFRDLSALVLLSILVLIHVSIGVESSPLTQPDSSPEEGWNDISPRQLIYEVKIVTPDTTHGGYLSNLYIPKYIVNLSENVPDLTMVELKIFYPEKIQGLENPNPGDKFYDETLLYENGKPIIFEPNLADYEPFIGMAYNELIVNPEIPEEADKINFYGPNVSINYKIGHRGCEGDMIKNVSIEARATSDLRSELVLIDKDVRHYSDPIFKKYYIKKSKLGYFPLKWDDLDKMGDFRNISCDCVIKAIPNIPKITPKNRKKEL